MNRLAATGVRICADHRPVCYNIQVNRLHTSQLTFRPQNKTTTSISREEQRQNWYNIEDSRLNGRRKKVSLFKGQLEEP